MSESLIELTKELEDLIVRIDELEESGETVPEGMLVLLETALTSQAEKVDRCAMFVSKAKSQIDWLDDEIALLQAQKKRIERGIDRMKELARFVMNREGVRELTGLRGHKFSLRDSFSVAVIDESSVPAEFTRIVTKIEVNKAEALKSLKNGVEVSGLLLQKNENIIVK